MTKFKLPKEFVELNECIKQFNTGANVQLFGEGKYLLLQGSRVKGYNLFLCAGEIGQGRIEELLSAGMNKRAFINVFEVIERLAIRTLPIINK